MYRSAKFPPPAWSVVWHYLQSQTQCKMIAAEPKTSPEATLIPYVILGNTHVPNHGTLEVHLVQGDPTLSALHANPHASVLIDQPLSLIPHTVFDRLDTSRTMLLFRSVLLRGTVNISMNLEEIGAGLERLAQFLEPNTAYAPITHAQYGERLARLAHVTMVIEQVEVKWKLGQDQPYSAKVLITDFLKNRNTPIDQITWPILEDYWAVTDAL